MSTRQIGPDRLHFFSNLVFALIITLLLLGLPLPQSWELETITSLWPIALSYALSYLFIVLVWINHYRLLRHPRAITSQLIWANFAHLFSVSLLPFATAWIAQTQLAAIPVSLYAGVLIIVNATYLFLFMQTLNEPEVGEIPTQVRNSIRVRSLITLGLFAAAAILALRCPIGGVILICLGMVAYLRPQALVPSEATSTTQ